MLLGTYVLGGTNVLVRANVLLRANVLTIPSKCAFENLAMAAESAPRKSKKFVFCLQVPPSKLVPYRKLVPN